MSQRKLGDLSTLVNPAIQAACESDGGRRRRPEEPESQCVGEHAAKPFAVVVVVTEAHLVERNAPPQKPGEEVKLLYASQIDTAPPTLAIVSNRPDEVPESYQRYLAHGFREAWPFTGSPLRLKFTRRGSRR